MKTTKVSSLGHMLVLCDMTQVSSCILHKLCSEVSEFLTKITKSWSHEQRIPSLEVFLRKLAVF